MIVFGGLTFVQLWRVKKAYRVSDATMLLWIKGEEVQLLDKPAFLDYITETTGIKIDPDDLYCGDYIELESFKRKAGFYTVDEDDTE